MINLRTLYLMMCEQYDQLRIGNYNKLDGSVISTVKDPAAREELAISIIRYVSETYWEWTPEMLRDHLTYERIQDWGLVNIIKFVRFPVELKPKVDMFYIAHLAYPKIVTMNAQDVYLTVYQNLLNGKIARFPKGFFEYDKGQSKICACLRYAIENYHPFSSIEEMYHFFGSKSSLKFLKEVKLLAGVQETFDCRIEVLHNTLPPSDRIEYLFQYYRFQQLFKASKKG
ncbi:MAG: hypothetical protein IJ341_02095 [Bacteroidales bacterium]|nr:hypothetical protein [Bacteroidales bacterium]